MKKLIIGLIGVIWGGSLVGFWATSNGSQENSGIAIGAVMLVAGIYYLYQWNKER